MSPDDNNTSTSPKFGRRKVLQGFLNAAKIGAGLTALGLLSPGDSSTAKTKAASESVTVTGRDVILLFSSHYDPVDAPLVKGAEALLQRDPPPIKISVPPLPITVQDFVNDYVNTMDKVARFIEELIATEIKKEEQKTGSKIRLHNLVLTGTLQGSLNQGLGFNITFPDSQSQTGMEVNNPPLNDVLPMLFQPEANKLRAYTPDAVIIWADNAMGNLSQGSPLIEMAALPAQTPVGAIPTLIAQTTIQDINNTFLLVLDPNEVSPLATTASALQEHSAANHGKRDVIASYYPHDPYILEGAVAIAGKASPPLIVKLPLFHYDPAEDSAITIGNKAASAMQQAIIDEEKQSGQRLDVNNYIIAGETAPGGLRITCALKDSGSTVTVTVDPNTMEANLFNDKDVPRGPQMITYWCASSRGGSASAVDDLSFSQFDQLTYASNQPGGTETAVVQYSLNGADITNVNLMVSQPDRSTLVPAVTFAAGQIEGIEYQPESVMQPTHAGSIAFGPRVRPQALSSGFTGGRM